MKQTRSRRKAEKSSQTYFGIHIPAACTSSEKDSPDAKTDERLSTQIEDPAGSIEAAPGDLEVQPSSSEAQSQRPKAQDCGRAMER